MLNRQKSLRIGAAIVAFMLISSIAFASNWSESFKWLDFSGSSTEAANKPVAENSVSKKNNQSLSPQTVVLSENFEGATPFLTANVAATNQWFIGTAANNGGTMGAYVSNDLGVTNVYGLATTSTNHIYAPITVPAGESAITLSFDWRGVGEFDGSFDYMRVSVMAAPPVGGTAPALAEQLPLVFNAQDNFTKAHVNLPANIADGVVRYLVFTWRNDNSLGNQTPAAIDNVLVTSLVPAPLSGTKTIPGDYPTVAAAIANVNAHGADTSGGSLTFNVAAGSSFVETPVPLTVSGSSATNRVIFQKSGAGANPLITAEGGSYSLPVATTATTTGDGIIALNGVDFVTFDGIDTASSSVLGVSPFTTIEAGYLLRNNNTLNNVLTINGSQSNIIQNVSVDLDRRKLANTPYGIISTATTTFLGSTPINATQANSNNDFLNLTIVDSFSGIYMLGTAAFPDLNNEIGNTSPTAFNTIGTSANPIGGTASSSYGIRATSQSGIQIYNNDIGFVSSTGAVNVHGIFLENVQGTNEVRFNRVHDISTTSTSVSALLYGIRADTNSGATTTVQNNMIWGFSHGITTASATIVGRSLAANVTGTGTANLYFNSVRQQLGTAATNSALYVGGGTIVSRNNIWANFTPTQTGLAKHYAIWFNAAPASYTASNNVLHINSGTGVSTNGFTGRSFPAADQTTLTDWQTATGQESASFAQNPQFVSATNLHIQTVPATPVESAGTPIGGITTDIDNNTRNVTTPDIGADEGTFVPLLVNDIAATAVLVPVPGSTILNGSISTPQASFTNAGTANQVSVNVQFTITGPGGYSYTNTQTIASILSGQTLSQTFLAAPAYTTAGLYTATAINLFADSNTANDSIVATFTVSDPLSGSYSVPGSYPSLTNAGGMFEAINSLGASGAVTVNITNDLTGETGAVTLNPIAGSPTVLIKPSGAPRTISGTAPIAVIRINGADNIRLDGSTAALFVDNVVGGTPALRELTVRNDSTSITSGVIALHSNTDGAQNNRIQNVIVVGNDPLTTLVGISMGGATIGSLGTDNDGNRIINCSVRRATFGIFSGGAISPNQNTGTIIQENDITATGVDRVARGGIFVSNEDGVQIVENSVGGMQLSVTFSTVFGIGVGTNTISDTFLTSGGVINANVTRNRINGVVQDNTGPAVGIAVAGGTTGPNTISNNMITGVISDGNSGDLPAGIFVAGTAGSDTRLYYNSVSMTGDRSVGAFGGTGQLPSYGVAITGTDPVVELKNNIFYNSQVAEAVANPGALSFGIGMQSAAFTNLNSNFNDFHSIGVRDGGFRTTSLGNTGGVNLIDLPAWNTAIGGADDIPGDSLEVDPSFVDPLSDLHLVGIASLLYDQGTPVSELRDFDNQLRTMVGFAGGVPDIGGDEALAPLAAEGSISGRVMAADGVGIRNAVITVSGGTLTEPRVIRTSAFGYYAIDGLDLGSTYVVTIRAKRFEFANPSVVVTLQENVGDLDFQAIP